MKNAVQFEWTKDQYGLVRLNRPDKRNAISLDMIERLKVVLAQAKNLPIKCLVLTGAGENTFCAGGDLNDLNPDLTTEGAFSVLYPMKEVLYELADFPLPTICLLNGDAYGGGCELATACDFRIAKAGTRFGFIQSHLGIAPGWGGATLLYEKIHPVQAHHWIVKGDIREASQLQATGWIQDVFSPQTPKNYNDILNPYFERSKEQMEVFKHQYKNKVSMLALSAQMNEDVRACSRLWGNPAHKQAIRDFHQK